MISDPYNRPCTNCRGLPVALNNNSARPPNPATEPTPQFLGVQWYWWALIGILLIVVMYLAFA